MIRRNNINKYLWNGTKINKYVGKIYDYFIIDE